MPKKIAPETLAHLIKSFLRALPGGVLGGLPSEVITECVDDAGCERLLQALRPPERTLLCWIVRVVYEVASCTEENKMVPAPSPGTNVDWHVRTEDVHLTRGSCVASGQNVRNLTLVLAPNLFGPPNPKANPMEELMLIKAATETLHKFVSAAIRGTKGPDSPVLARV